MRSVGEAQLAIQHLSDWFPPSSSLYVWLNVATNYFLRELLLVSSLSVKGLIIDLDWWMALQAGFNPHSPELQLAYPPDWQPLGKVLSQITDRHPQLKIILDSRHYHPQVLADALNWKVAGFGCSAHLVQVVKNRLIELIEQRLS